MTSPAVMEVQCSGENIFIFISSFGSFMDKSIPFLEQAEQATTTTLWSKSGYQCYYMVKNVIPLLAIYKLHRSKSKNFYNQYCFIQSGIIEMLSCVNCLGYWEEERLCCAATASQSGAAKS